MVSEKVRMFSASEVEHFVAEALHLNNINAIFNVRIVDGALSYQNCIPNVHWLRNIRTKEECPVVAADDTVIVVETKSGVTEIIYVHSLGDYEIFTKKQTAASAPASVDPYDAPGIGSVYTHRSGRVYLVFGVLNMNRNAEKRATGEYEEIVCYVGANGFLWGKVLSNFHETMTLGGRFEFNEGVQMEYMGIVENDVLSEGFMTSNIKKLLENINAEPE